jgi:hypothetical protein
MCAAVSRMATHNLVATQKLDGQWQSLGSPRTELTLDFTLPTGQSFRWRKSDEQEYTGVVHDRLVPPPCTSTWLLEVPHNFYLSTYFLMLARELSQESPVNIPKRTIATKVQKQAEFNIY